MFRNVHNGLAENGDGVQVMFGLEKIVYIDNGKRVTLEDWWSDAQTGGLAHDIWIPHKPHWDKPHDTEELSEVVLRRRQADIRDGIATFSGKPPEIMFTGG